MSALFFPKEKSMTKLRKSVPYLLLAILWVLADQLLKYWVRTTIPLYESVKFLPGVMDLTYVQNTGAAFSILSTHTWILALVSLFASVLLLLALLKQVLPGFMGQFSLALLLGGAVGNLIDRVALGYVVDMFHLEFMRFAVFNVADIGVTCGGALLLITVLLQWKREKELTA